MRGTNFLVITLAFGQVIWGLAIKLEKVTGGSDGIPGVPRPDSIGPINFTDPKVMFAFMVIVIAIVVTLAMRLLNGPLGSTTPGLYGNPSCGSSHWATTSSC